MTDPARSRWPWLLFGLALLLVVAAAALFLIGGPGDGLKTEDLVFLPVVLLTILGYSTVGAILASRNTRNLMGWIMLTVGMAFALAQATETYATYTLEIDPGALPFGAVAAWFGTWDYAVAFSALLVLALLYPSGRVVSPRWRWVPWIVIASASIAALGTALAPGSLEVETGFAVDNPFGLEVVRPIVEITGAIGWIGLLASIPVSIASLVLRYRRSEGESRQQIRWLVFVAVGVIAALVLVLATRLTFGKGFDRSIGPVVFFGIIFSLIGVGVPVAMGVAVLKYRLYDLDLVIKKTVVYGILALLVFVTGGILVRLATGLVFVSRGGNGLLPAGIVIGLLVWPLRRLALKIADRLVFGGRSTPYEVLTEFSARAAETYGAEDVLERMSQVLAAGVGAESATVWLRTREGFDPGATWPIGDAPTGAIPADAIEVRDHGELLGALSVRTPANDPMTPSKERLIRDLAGQAGLVLRNAKLITDLRASRQRLVAAQDEERRRLERNIHDGAQQQLVALAVKLGLIERYVASDPQRAASMLAEARSETNDALDDLRDLARGIYPPLLADKGLVAALESQARKSLVPVDIEPDGIGRYAQDAEVAIYFSCLEALQNVAKYAGATKATVRLAQADGNLTFEVIDDGVGFDPVVATHGSGLLGIADRLAALGGDVTVRSAPGDGTTVAGRVPVREATR